MAIERSSAAIIAVLLMFHGAGVESLTGVNNNICLLFIMVSFANVC